MYCTSGTECLSRTPAMTTHTEWLPGVELVINLHWRTANVNHISDRFQDVEDVVVISKDAKAIIPSDMTAFQHPGHAWRQ